MAEGLLRDMAGDSFDVFSAGTHPSKVHPMSTAVMAEDGIDISEHTSDFIDDYLNKGIDIVITVCDSADSLCPSFPGDVERIHWSIDDPFQGWDIKNNKIDSYRETRDILKKNIKELIKNHLKIEIYIMKVTAKDPATGKTWEDVQTVVLAKKL